jgi:signal transduction histidine kinase
MRILLLEDADFDVVLTGRFMPEGAELVVAKNKTEFSEALDKGPFDILVLDYAIPGWSGIAAAVEARKKWPEIPVLIFSGTITDDMIPPLEAQDIDDVMLKDRPHRLRWAIRRAIRDRERLRNLQQSQREALEAQSIALEAQRQAAVGEVASGLAHDMRNMLTPIMGILHLFERYVPEAQMGLLKGAQRSADRIVAMIDRMMLFVSGRNGHKENVSMRQVVLEFIQFLPGIIPTATITSKVTTEAVIAIDPTVIRQVILNFCINSKDAGATHLEVRAEDVDIRDYKPNVGGFLYTGKFVKISVRDDGSGVPPEVMGKMFETFFSTKPVGKGSGIGLSTVRTIATKYDGFVDVQSDPPNGSTFSAFFAIK